MPSVLAFIHNSQVEISRIHVPLGSCYSSLAIVILHNRDCGVAEVRETNFGTRNFKPRKLNSTFMGVLKPVFLSHLIASILVAMPLCRHRLVMNFLSLVLVLQRFYFPAYPKSSSENLSIAVMSGPFIRFSWGFEERVLGSRDQWDFHNLHRPILSFRRCSSGLPQTISLDSLTGSIHNQGIWLDLPWLRSPNSVSNSITDP
jgi:hypothetical protein